MRINQPRPRLMRIAPDRTPDGLLIMPPRRKKATATELADMIKRQLGHSATIVVYPHETLGFIASGMTADGKPIATQRLVDAVVVKLRTGYQLAE
jgi:hypothetical protein